jgi:hypothetical protein
MAVMADNARFESSELLLRPGVAYAYSTAIDQFWALDDPTRIGDNLAFYVAYPVGCHA